MYHHPPDGLKNSVSPLAKKMNAASQDNFLAKPLRDAVYAIAPGDFDAVARLLGVPLWDALEGDFWNASHPLPPHARHALDAYLYLAKTLWHKAGLGQSHPIAMYKTTLLSSRAIETALRVLARIYAGCNLGFCAPPPGFWRTVYALTGYLISERFPDRKNRDALTNQILQIWLMAWLNPLSLAPGRLPVAVRLVGILCKTCSFTLASPPHAGSGLAAADLFSDAPPMPFARVPAKWEPIAPLYINAQDAAFTMRELATPPSRHAPSDVYESLLQSALQVGLSPQEMQDFVRRAMREFGYNNGRVIPRVGRASVVFVVTGFIECWGALQSQTKPKPNTASTQQAFSTCSAMIVNHSEFGFLLRFELVDPLLCTGTIIALRANDAEPWTLAAVRWLEDAQRIVMAGCEIICNYADALIAQRHDSKRHFPVISYQRDEVPWLLCPYDAGDVPRVVQLRIDNNHLVVSVANELGQDWQCSAVLDTQRCEA